MTLDFLSLQNFRNYDRVNLSFNKKINIFIGDNAQGKTNILESIYVLSITKSHRLLIQDNLIKENSLFTKIDGEITKKNKKSKLSILINNQGKTVSINSLSIKKISDYIATLNVIIFSPDDIDLIKGSPGGRRKYLNIEIGQLHHRYFIILNQYNQVLRNRNEYLKKISFDKYDKDYIEIVNDQLVEKAIQIYEMRKKFIDHINNIIINKYKEITGQNELQLKYETSILIDEIDDDKNKVALRLKEKLKNNLQREIIMGQTMAGPHRDDFSFVIDGLDIRNYGSQGQQKMAVICLKLSEIDLFKDIKGEYPVLLLDDIFSELDDNKKNNVIKMINLDIQTFLTSTDINKIEKELLNNADIFYIDKAKITKR